MIGFIIGVFVGGLIGTAVAALVSVNRDEGMTINECQNQ